MLNSLYGGRTLMRCRSLRTTWDDLPAPYAWDYVCHRALGLGRDRCQRVGAFRDLPDRHGHEFGLSKKYWEGAGKGC
jgi:hypothetical protein